MELLTLFQNNGFDYTKPNNMVIKISDTLTVVMYNDDCYSYSVDFETMINGYVQKLFSVYLYNSVDEETNEIESKVVLRSNTEIHATIGEDTNIEAMLEELYNTNKLALDIGNSLYKIKDNIKELLGSRIKTEQLVMEERRKKKALKVAAIIKELDATNPVVSADFVTQTMKEMKESAITHKDSDFRPTKAFLGVVAEGFNAGAKKRFFISVKLTPDGFEWKRGTRVLKNECDVSSLISKSRVEFW